MLTRLKWLVSGALAAAFAIAGGSVYLNARHEHAEEMQRQAEAAIREAEQLRIQNEQLEQERKRLAAEAARLEAEKQALAQVVERLNIENRVAQVDVLQQHTDASGEVVQTVLRLTEIGRDGEPLEPRIIGVPSKIPHFDALVIKFDKDHVARGDALRGQSLALFRRVYGDNQAPEDGYWLSTPGEVPDVYRVADEPTEFERELWRDFWSYAKDPDRAADAGVRVAQGEAVYAPMSAGERWALSLEANGGLNLIKQGNPPTSIEDLASPPTVSADVQLHAAPPFNDQHTEG